VRIRKNRPVKKPERSFDVQTHTPERWKEWLPSLQQLVDEVVREQPDSE